MATISIQEAQAKLTELIHCLPPGEELLILENNLPVAKLTTNVTNPNSMERKFGTLKGTVKSMEHFDDELEDFKQYME